MSPKRVIFFAAMIVFTLSFIITASVRTEADSPGNGDELFLQQAVKSASWMSTLGELAEKQAASGDIRKYGAQMAGDYRKNISELKLLAGKKSISLSPDTNKLRQSTTQYLSQKYGADFDRDYISLMVEENQEMASSYRSAAQKGSDAEIRSFASEKIKILEGYVARAYQILLDTPKPLLK
jgi:putative membrane protein